MGKKYDFTGETKVVNGVTLRRIRASKDFYVQAPCNTATEKSAGEATGLALVPKGTLGGWIEKRNNLSSKDSAWVADEACVWGDAQVIENGLVYGRAKVCDGTRIEKCGRVLGRAVVRHSVVTDQAVIFGNADITNGHFSEDARVYDDVRIGGGGVITVSGNGTVCGKAQIICSRGSKVFVHIGGEACVCEMARIRCMGRREIMISGKAMVCDRAVVLGIPSPTASIWGRSTVYHILTNEKYTGNMILQKTYRPDFRTKKGKINQGQVAKYEVTDSHEAIISETDFAAVQENLQLSRKNYPNVYRGGIKYLFSGLIKCGCCGGCYIHKMNGTGKYKHPVWICRRFAELGKAVCLAKGIPEPILIEKTKEVLSLGVDDTLSREYLLEKLSEITVAAPHQLIYHLRDGTEITVEWQHKSRSEGWTPEMREKARERAIKQRRKEREQHADS